VDGKRLPFSGEHPPAGRDNVVGPGEAAQPWAVARGKGLLKRRRAGERSGTSCRLGDGANEDSRSRPSLRLEAQISLARLAPANSGCSDPGERQQGQQHDEHEQRRQPRA
jgi:hypothetical protein